MNYAAVRMHDLLVTVSYEPFDRAWQAIVIGAGFDGARRTLAVDDEDGEKAVSTAIGQFVDRYRPKTTDQ